MDNSASRRQIVILDCCHSGAFMRGAKRAKGDPALTAETFDPVGYGRYVLTACSATEFAWEDDSFVTVTRIDAPAQCSRAGSWKDWLKVMPFQRAISSLSMPCTDTCEIAPELTGQGLPLRARPASS
jgi:uncharacterized caspase-like protein